MKKISVWKVVLLVVVTLGLYAIYWAARNRDYIKKHEKKAGYLPAWGWLVFIPAAGFLLIGSVIVLMFVSMFGGIDADTTLVAVNALLIGYVVAVMAVGVWWVWFFGQAMEKVIHGGISRNWAVALFIFTGPLLAAFYQFYINVGADKRAAKQSEPGSVFMFLAIGAMAISLISSVINTADYVRSLPQLKTEIQQAQEQTKGLVDAYSAYAKCDAELFAKYPNGKPEEVDQQAAYASHLERCEDLNREYQRQFDAIGPKDL